MSEIARYGSVVLYVLNYVEQTFDQEMQRLTQSPDGQRDGQRGFVKAVWSTFHSGGLRPKLQGIASWQRDLDKYYSNQGLWTHVPLVVCLPYLLQVQTQVTGGADISGFRSASLRASPVVSTLGSGSGQRWYCALGRLFYRNVSTGDHSLQVATTSGLPAADMRCAAEIVENGARKLAIGFRLTGNGSGIYATTDPTAATVAFSALTNAGQVERFYGIASLQFLGTGYTVAYGVFRDPAGPVMTSNLAYNSNTAQMSTSLAKVVDAATGADFSLPLGGYWIGEDPAAKNEIAMVMPPSSEETSASLPRNYWRAKFSLNASGVPVATLQKLDTGLSHVECLCYFLGGTAFAGDSQNGIGTRVTLLGADGNIRDLNFPGLNGSSAVGVVAMQGHGLALRVLTAKMDGSDAQEWLWADGKWHPHTPLASLAAGGGTGGLPIGFTTPASWDPLQQRAYWFAPNKTNTAQTDVYRYFFPRDPFANPLLSNTSEKKHYGSLTLTGLDMDYLGPVPEANKAFTRVLHGGRSLSATSGSYGTVTVAVSVDGGATTAFSNVFDQIFEVYSVPLGQAFKTAMPQVTLSNGSTNEANAVTKTPNALPLVFEGVAKWAKLSEFQLQLDINRTLQANHLRHVTELTALLKRQENVVINPTDSKLVGSPVQRFTLGKFDGLATWETYSIAARAPTSGRATHGFGAPPTVTFREAPGSVRAP
jgi:hypothetical protein